MSDLFMDMQQWQPYNNDAATAANGWPRTRNGSTSESGSGSTTTTPATCHSAHAATHNGHRAEATAAANDVDEGEEDAFENVLSLRLRKPKRWNWELTTSRSCSNIALPRILLYDHKGTLLVDADSQQEQTYGPQQPHAARTTTPIATGSRKRASKSATANLAQSIRKALDRQFTGLQIQEATPSTSPSRTTSTAANTPATTPTTVDSAAIDFYSNELPDYKFQRRAHSLKGVRFKVDHDGSGDAEYDIYNGSDALRRDAQSLFNIANLPTPPSTVTTTTTPTNSSSSGPRGKRRYRCSHSSGRSPANSESILERFSYNKGRFSSPEYAVEQQLYQAPRYFLRTSKAGTLVVQEDSFSRYRRRRKARNSSTENVQKSDESGVRSALRVSDTNAGSGSSAVGVAQLQCCNAQNAATAEQPTRRKAYPVRRYRSDGNVLLQRHLSTSEEEAEEQNKSAQPQQQRKYAGYRRQSKKALLNIAADKALLTPQDASTMR